MTPDLSRLIFIMMNHAPEGFVPTGFRDQPMSYAEVHAQMDTQHYVVFRQFYPPSRLSPEVVASLRREVLERMVLMDTVFNSNGGSVGDSKRLQINVAANTWPPECERLFEDITARMTRVLPRRAPNDMVILYSLAGCLEQPPHSDWTDESLRNVCDDGVYGGYPVACLMALEAGTSLLVSPGSSCLDESVQTDSLRMVRVALEPGDMLMFRADLVHAGDAYPTTANMRLHVYGDRRSVKRARNTTFLIKE